MFGISSSFGQSYCKEIDDTIINSFVSWKMDFSNYKDLDGYTYSYNRDEVFSIQYENGKKELMTVTTISQTNSNILKKRVALGNIKDNSGYKNGNASAKLASVFITELFKSEKYHVIEQDAIADLIKDGDLSPTSSCFPSPIAQTYGESSCAQVLLIFVSESPARVIRTMDSRSRGGSTLFRLSEPIVLSPSEPPIPHGGTGFDQLLRSRPKLL